MADQVMGMVRSAVALLVVVTLTMPLFSRMLKAQATRPAVTPAATASSSITPEDLIAGATDYVFGQNDMIRIVIGDLVDTVQEYVQVSRVGDSGFINLPKVEPVRVAGKTEAQLVQSIKQAYKDAKLLAEPQVMVVIVEAYNRTFTIGGDVNRAGEYQIISKDFRLSDAMVLAGGSKNGNDIRVIRTIADPANPRLIDIPGQAIAAKDAKFNIVVRPGDLITVTESKPVDPSRK